MRDLTRWKDRKAALIAVSKKMPLSTVVVRERFGCSKSSARHWLRRLETECPEISIVRDLRIIRPQGGVRLSNDAMLEILRPLCLAGATNEEMARELGVGSTTVSTLLKRTGLKDLRPRRKVSTAMMGRARLTAQHNSNRATAAAQFLGRWFRPVYRANISDSRTDPSIYIVGDMRMHYSEMMEMAAARGFII